MSNEHKDWMNDTKNGQVSVSLDEPVRCEIIPDQESCQPTPTISVLYCDNFGCAANEEERCMSTVGECYGYIKPNDKDQRQERR